MPIPCDDQGMTLFQASTIIKLGDGKKAKFWWDKWLDGETPKDIASHLFALVHFKQRTVCSQTKIGSEQFADYPVRMSSMNSSIFGEE
jgi:hypothetical protein